jgi:hypothetical protein
VLSADKPEEEGDKVVSTAKLAKRVTLEPEIMLVSLGCVGR